MYRYIHKFMYKCANVFVYALCLCAYVYVMICIIHVWAITLYHGVCLYMCVFTNACPYACLCVCFMMCMYSLYFCACVCYSLDTFMFVCFVCIYSYMCVCMYIHACRPLCLHVCTIICIYPVCMRVFAQVHGRFIYFHSWIMWLQCWQVSWDGNPGRAEVTVWSQKVEIPPPREASAISLGAFNWWSEATHSTGGTCFTQRLLSQVLIMFLKITTAVSNHCLVQCVDTIFIPDKLTQLMGRGLLCFLRPGTCISISLGIQLSGKGSDVLKTNKQKTMLWLGCHSVVQHLPMHATYKNQEVNNKQ